MLLLLEFLFVAFVSHASHCHGANTAQAFSLPDADHLALMSFKSHITSDPSQAMVSWGNGSIPMCQWPGVKCGFKGRRRGRVVALDLPELNLGGTIVPELANITHLRRLYLSYNAFHGILPPELGNLPDLETIRLTFNSIQGQIPPSFSNCSRLVEISLYGNKLQGGIPGEFASLHNLEILFLGENRLTGRIPPGIGSLVNLKRLILQNDNLTGEIPTELGRLVNLNELNLNSNQFSGTIPASFGNLSALTYLNIASNNLEGSIPPLHDLSSLTGLELGLNKLQGTIPTWLGNLSSLLVIDLQKNDLVGQIPESLGKLELLENLVLANNKLSGSLPHGLGNLHALIGLYINNNGLEGSFPAWIFNFSSLETLEMNLNNFSGVLPLDVGSQLPKLKIFLISDNQFHGVLPSSLCNASMLQKIVTNTNYLSGTIPRCLGSHQKNLSVVELAVNGFEITNDADWGFLTSLTNCSNLRILEISSNKLHGVLPNSIGNLSTQMKALDLADNNITGKITEGIGNLISLRELYMEYNMITGPIPESLGNLKMLTELHILSNALSGSIPVTLGNLTELSTLLLGTNAISGDIPGSLRNCPLLVLDLSYNNLSGQIPKEIFSISTLTSLFLSHNSLYGTLPSEVGNLKNLGDLDLSHNRISGEIPTSIGECESMEYLKISGNILQGTIPLSLGNLRGLLVLDVSYNNLLGTIPEVLASLRGLSSLNLSFNKFQGEVPENGVFLNSTAILITGNDGLCGGIPKLKLPPCSNHTRREPHRKLAVIVSICLSAFVFVALIFALSIFYQKSQKSKRNLQRSALSEKYTRISYAELVNTTSGFSSENLVGVGSFGSVYKGRMRINGQHVLVAVKVLNLTQRGATQSFIAECETLRCARHRNLVKILTVCSSIDFQGRDFKALVYEFLPNGNLDQWLHQHIMEDGENKALDLIGRLHIVVDVACSLDYLHQYKPTPIVHCDLKPSNILLDSDMVAHVGDFGLARFLHQDTYQSSGWASMRGSIGYAAPEYGLGNEVSIHGDVYSYGILLLEMFTGKGPTDSEFGEAIGLRKYVQMALPDRVSTIMDQQLLIETQDDEARMSYPGSTRDLRISCITSILQVGICCSDETPTDRPPIGDALKELQAIRDKFHKQLSGSVLREHHGQATIMFEGFSGA